MIVSIAAVLLQFFVFQTLQAAERLAFVDVSVLPMDANRILEKQSVLIEDGVITAMGPETAISIPKDTKIINAKGKYLMPGLSDMHAHIAGYADTTAEGANISNQVAENQLLLYAATGVTLLRDTAGSTAHFTHQKKLQSGQWLGPELYFTSPVLEGKEAVWGFSLKLINVGDVEPLIAKFATEGYWGIKIYHTLSAEVYAAVLESAKRHNIHVIGHVPFEVGIDKALKAGQYSIEHFRGYDFDGLSLEELQQDGGRSAKRFSSWVNMTDDRMAELANLTVIKGIWNCPTLSINRFLFDSDARAALAKHARFAMVHPGLQAQILNSNALDDIFPVDARAAIKASLPRQKALIKQLREFGGKLLIGTDAVLPSYVPGFTPIDEMQAFEEAGLSRFDILQIATIKAAKSLGIEDRAGTIAIGKKTNMILVDDNPLSDLDALWQLSGVVINGEWHSHEDLKDRLEKMSQNWSSQN